MMTMTPEEIEQWPTLRWQTVRRAALAVVWKGPLLGLGFAVLLIGAIAWFDHRAGETLDFGWFQIPGQAGAPGIPVLSRFCTAAPVLILVGTAFLALVGAAAVVTCEVAYRRGPGATRGGDS
jgi:uncharacterized membrane protein